LTLRQIVMPANSRNELISSGCSLAGELESLAREYHVKSDNHEILLWEAAIIDAAVEHLRTGAVIFENLQGSALLSAWGEKLAMSIPSVAARVRQFHKDFANECGLLRSLHKME
jgi:hypothetical protein